MLVQYTHEDNVLRFTPPYAKRARTVVVEPLRLRFWLTRILGVSPDFDMDQDFTLDFSKHPHFTESLLDSFSKSSDIRAFLHSPNSLINPNHYLDDIASDVTTNFLRSEIEAMKVAREKHPESFDKMLSELLDATVASRSPVED